MDQKRITMTKSPPPNERPNILSTQVALRSISGTILDLIIRYHELANDTISQRNRISNSTVSRARNGRPVSIEYGSRLTNRINNLLREREDPPGGEQTEYKFEDLFELA